MFFEAFLKGVAAGLLIAAPVGPVGVLCVHRTLAWGRVHGLLSGLGAAVADALFAAIVAFGLGFVSDFLLTQQKWLRLGGGILLLLLGIKNLLSKPPAPDVAETQRSLAGDSASAFVLTITNPITILSFIGVFAALGVTGENTLVEADGLVLGVFSGSALWWLTISGGVGLIRRVMETVFLRRVHIVSGVVLLLFGIGVLAALAL
ncbi:MAG TPA: LysE family transporter [Alphaproteobacteria bacterium]|jgi:threonine/homoserine/homoserine lactone efflux protein|nr:LysE family transporter [Alphaproteobacteria bacterium]